MKVFRRQCNVGRAPVLLVTALSLGVLSACTGQGDAADSKTAREEAAETMRTVVAEVGDMSVQIEQVSRRLVVACMEEQSFDIHPEELTADPAKNHDEDLWESLHLGFGVPHQFALPTADEAAAQGFGTSTYRRVPVARQETDPYEEMPEDYRNRYEDAWHGREWADYNRRNGSMVQDGEKWPMMGGCQLTVDETLWGEQDDYLNQTDVYFYDPKPVTPPAFDEQFQRERFTTMLIEDFDEWSTCLADRGHPYFEVHPQHGHRLRIYAEFFYEESWLDGDPRDRPGDYGPDYFTGLEPPTGAPWADATAMEMERQLAVDAAECDAVQGLTEKTESAWTRMLSELSVEYEVEIFEWAEAFEAALDRAQAAM